MRVIIEPAALNKCLKNIQPAINVNNLTQPILVNILCHAKKNEIEFIGTNLNLTATSKADCECEKEFDFLLPYQKVANMASIAKGVLTIDIDTQILITGQNQKWELCKSEDVINFPSVDQFDPHFNIDIDETFLYYLQNAANFVSNDANQVIFNNICLDFDGKNASIVSTDAMSLFLYKDAFKVDKIQYLVDTNFAKAAKTFKSASFGGNEKFVSLSDGNFKIICRVSENKFPDYKNFFSEYKTNCTVSKSRLISALDELMVFESKLHVCDIIFLDKQIRVAFKDAHTGENFKSDIPCEHSVEFEKISFNAVHLKNILSALPDTDKVLMSFKSPNAVAHFDTEGSDLNLILIPIFNNTQK